MKKSYLKKFFAGAFLLSVIGASPVISANAVEMAEEKCIFPVKNSSSEYGECEVTYRDEYGKEFSPVLIPKYGDRAVKYPVKYDLRDINAVTSVKNQNPTGCCWAFSALASAESNLIMKNYADSSIDLSEAHLIWFGNCKASPNELDCLFADGENNGIDGYDLGGSNMTAIETLARWNGARLEKSVPPASELPEIDESERYLSDFHLEGNDIVDASDITAVKSHMMRMGACMASYYDADEYFSERNSSYCCTEKERTNHAVTVIGWDDDYSRKNFVSPPEKDGAWLCKNSWGSKWGDDGFFWLSYYDVNLARITFFDMEKADNYDCNYQYDGMLSHYRFFENAGIAAANVFQSSGNEILSAVSFNTIDADNPYIIRVYKNLTAAADPTSGELVSEQRGNMAYAGYHTVKLDKPVFMQGGTYFSVEVIFEKTGSMFYMDEKPSGTGVSFYASYYPDDGGVISKWWDSCKRVESNVCIKAFTNLGVIIDSENFPDENFREFVSENFDKNNDGYLTSDEYEPVEEMNVSDMNIYDFTGIEFFTSLKSLDCSGNPINKLNLSDLYRMKTLVCENCVRNLGDVSCVTLIGNIPDDSGVSDISGGYFTEYGQFIPQGNTISYTYDCGNGKSAVFKITADSLQHKNTSFESYNEKFHTFVCNDCGYSEWQNHEYTDYMPYDEKSHAKFCKQCGEIIMSEHEFGEYTIDVHGIKSRDCETCGYHEEIEKINFTRGDITGDDRTDIFDFILLRKAITDGINGIREKLACDFNLDGKINVSDLVDLNNYILGKK
ncbi:MAG: hypothetical protein IKS03_07060 [Ruminococcus sp.]|nr:hypothetical protein [Ruminococcus sp.]